ncbi:MAG: hypothetical protein HYX35_04940 [Proteobacteria bacterium]|nr:hypothetical protein [Pseudomonadota bacterium]
MKISVLLSIIAVTFAFVVRAEAALQCQPSSNLSACVATATDQPSIDCYNGIQNCYTYSSDNEQACQNCLAQVESDYLVITNPGAQTPSSQEILNPAESDYYDIDGAKGWGNTSQP